MGVLLALVAGLLPARAAAQGARLLDPEADARAYRLVEEIAARVPPTRSLVHGAKPWMTADVRSWLVEIDSLTTGKRTSYVDDLIGHLRRDLSFGLEPAAGGSAWSSTGARLHAAAGEYELEPAFRDVRVRDGLGTPDAALEGMLHAGVEAPELDLAAALDLRALTNARNRHDLRVERDGDPEVAMRSAYLTWRSDLLLLAVGRIPLEWGNGLARGLGITAVGPARDGFLARARIGPAQFATFSAFLPDEPQNRLLNDRGNTIASSTPDPSEPRRAVDRYLFGHRVDVRVHDRLTLSVQEMALVTGVNRHMPLSFATGLVPYFALQASREEIDQTDLNIGVGLQYRWSPLDRLTLYGEFFANEVFVDTDLEQVVRGLLGRRSNTQGFQQGLRLADPLGLDGLALRIEWTRLEHFLYLHRGLNTNWEEAGVPLGSPLGPDQVEWNVGLELARPAGDLLLLADAGLVRRRRGIARITDFEDIQGAGVNRRTPRGPEETWWLGTGALGVLWPGVGEAGLRIRAGRIDTLRNVRGSSAAPVSMELSVTILRGWSRAI